MRTVHTIVNGSITSYEIKDVKEQIQSINSAIDYIIGVSGNYEAALDFLKKHGIETRLDCENVQAEGMPLLAELRDIRVTLEGRLCDLQTQTS